MTITRKQLVSKYASAIRNADASLFIGAGLSREGGYVDWKGLLRGCAQEIGLDLEREYDLVAVAQYYLNLRMGNRTDLTRILKDEFDRKGQFTENHSIIGRLPIPTVWTTNFDTLLEQAYDQAERSADVKRVDSDIGISKSKRDVVLFKMHGDISRLSEVVICKSDYERYAHNHPGFQTALQGDLTSKTFLFLGFSFADPHLNYMLGHLHALLEKNQQTHYAILRHVRMNHALGADAEPAFKYEKNKQNLQIGELARYNIQVHLIDQFSEVTEILRAIEKATLLKNTFVSGSANKYAESFDEDRMRDLCMHLGEALMDRDFRLISGIGLNIGDSVVKGALLKLYEKKDVAFEDHFMLRPFPRNLPPHVSEAHFIDGYRRNMISACGFALFLSGTSRANPISVGVMDEYRMARALGKTPIPIGATGFAAAEIWNDVAKERESIYGHAVSEELFGRLNDPALSNEEILRAVFRIIELVSDL